MVLRLSHRTGETDGNRKEVSDIQGVCIDETDVRTMADEVRHGRTSVRRSKQTPDAELLFCFRRSHRPVKQ